MVVNICIIWKYKKLVFWKFETYLRIYVNLQISPKFVEKLLHLTQYTNLSQIYTVYFYDSCNTVSTEW